MTNNQFTPCKVCNGNSLVKGCNRGVWYIYCARCHEYDSYNNGVKGETFQEVCDKWNEQNAKTPR